MILKNKKESKIDTCHNMDESQMLDDKWKKSNTKDCCVIPFTWHSREDNTLVIKAAQWFLGARGEGKNLTAKGHEELSGVMEMICIFFVVVVTWLYTLVKIHQAVCTLKMCELLLYINYTLIKLTGQKPVTWFIKDKS